MARPGLVKHPKFKRLAVMLGCPRPHALGHLEFLWEVGYESGNPDIGDATDVALACEYPGDPGRLVAALLDCGGKGRDGFIEEIPDRPGHYRIHDLLDHAPRYVKLRQERESQRKNKDLQPKCAHTVRSCAHTERHSPHPHPTPTPAPTPSPKEKTPNAGALPAAETAKARKLATGDHPDVTRYFTHSWEAKYHRPYPFRKVDGVKVADLLRACGGCVEDAKAVIDRYLANEDGFLNGHPLAMLTSASQLAKFLVAAEDPADRRAREVVEALRQVQAANQPCTRDRRNTA